MEARRKKLLFSYFWLKLLVKHTYSSFFWILFSLPNTISGKAEPKACYSKGKERAGCCFDRWSKAEVHCRKAAASQVCML